MNKSWHIGMLVLASLMGMANASASDIAIQGNWSVVSFFSDGAKAPSNAGYTGILIYDDHIVFDNLRFEAKTLRFRVNSKVKPMQLDILDERTTQLTRFAIFAISNDNLTICIGDPRPSDFRVKAGDGRQMFYLKREARD
jgi:uncharacterized protein (TIGR03067 family)